MLLAQEDVPFQAIPSSCPVFVGPTETERKLRTARLEDLVKGAIQEAPTIEPVVIVAEARDPMGPGQVRLGLPCLRDAQIVEAEIRRQMRLVVSLEERLGLDDVSPLREARAPPLVVLGDRVILRQVERQRAHRPARASGLSGGLIRHARIRRTSNSSRITSRYPLPNLRSGSR